MFCLFVIFFKDQSETLTSSNSLKSTKIVCRVCVYDYYLHFNQQFTFQILYNFVGFFFFFGKKKTNNTITLIFTPASFSLSQRPVLCCKKRLCKSIFKKNLANVNRFIFFLLNLFVFCNLFISFHHFMDSTTLTIDHFFISEEINRRIDAQ